MVIEEQALERLMQCPMMTPTGPSPAETCAFTLARWALRQTFEGKFDHDPHQMLDSIRGELIKVWKSSKMPGDPGKLARVAGFRLFNLMLDYEVIHLEEPYNLVLAEYTIQGRYALLRKRKGACLPYVLVLHTVTPGLKHDQALPPDVQTLSRYLHVSTTTSYRDAQVLHYPVFQGKAWTNKTVNPSLAKQYLSGMLRVAALRSQYPSAGPHCEGCLTRPCMEAFRGQDDNQK